MRIIYVKIFQTKTRWSRFLTFDVIKKHPTTYATIRHVKMCRKNFFLTTKSIKFNTDTNVLKKLVGLRILPSDTNYEYSIIINVDLTKNKKKNRIYNAFLDQFPEV